MSNPLDYIIMRGDLPFETDPVNEVDFFLFSQIAMPEYEGIVPNDGTEVSLNKAAREYFKTHTVDVRNLGAIQAIDCLPAFKEMARSRRFRNVMLSYYGNKVAASEDEQFSAITLKLSDDLIVVSFRGTDDTIIGWKEDFNIAVKDHIPAQKDAVGYLEKIAAKYSGRIVTVGHSKGGNLSIYASSMANREVRDRILYAFSFDGPGFRKEFFREPGYIEMKSRIRHIISQNSMIGTLLEFPTDRPNIVHSDAAGLIAHDGFHWNVKGPVFVKERGLSASAQVVNEGMDEALASMTDEERAQFSEAFFDALMSTGAGTLTEIKEINIQDAFRVIAELRQNKAISSGVAKIVRGLEKARHRRIIDEIQGGKAR